MTPDPTIDEILRAVCHVSCEDYREYVRQRRSGRKDHTGVSGKATVALRFFLGLSFPDIADALGYNSHSTVHGQYHKITGVGRELLNARVEQRINECRHEEHGNA